MGFIAGLIDVVDHLGRRLVKPKANGQYQPVRLKLWPGASTTCVDRGDGTSELQIAAPSDVLSYATSAAFRAATPPADGTFFRVVSPAGEFRYSASSGAGWADDGATVLKPNSVLIGSNGRAYSTKSSEHSATIAGARAMSGLYLHAKHVHIECHTERGDGGGGIFDVVIGDYTDDNGTVLICADGAVLLRRDTKAITPKLWGGRGDYNPVTDTGGATADAAIASVQAYALANGTNWELPEGIWLLTTTRIQVKSGTELRGFGLQKSVIATKQADAIFVSDSGYKADLLTAAYNWSIKDLSVVYFGDGTKLSSLIWVNASSRGHFERVGVAGKAVAGVLSERETAFWPDYPGGTGVVNNRGENYLGNWDVWSWRNDIPGSTVGRLDWGIKNLGSANGLTISGKWWIPVLGGVLVEQPTVDVPTSWGKSIALTIRDLAVEGPYVPGCAVKVSNGKAVILDNIYGEGCAKVLDIEDVAMLSLNKISGPAATGASTVTRCAVNTGLVHDAIIFEDCISCDQNGFQYSPADQALIANNVGHEGHGRNYEFANECWRVGNSQLDPVNTLPGGDFERWVSTNVPWNWHVISGSGVPTKCGVGCSDTTRPADTQHCVSFDGTAVVAYQKITGPVGPQFLNTPVSISVKCKRTSGLLQLILSDGATNRSTGGARNIDPTFGIEAEDGWHIVQFAFLVDEDMCTNGISLLWHVYEYAGYVGAVQATFGNACPREFVQCSRTQDGAVAIRANGNIEYVAAATPGANDPFSAQAVISGDAVRDSSNTYRGWVRTPTEGWLVDHWPSITSRFWDTLLDQLQLDLGGIVNSFYVGPDIVEESAGVAGTWPGRLGPVLANSTANRFATSTLGGYKCLAPGASTQVKSLLSPTALSIQTIWAVTEGHAAGDAYETLATAGNNLLLRDNTTSNWYTTGASHYVDGSATTAIPASGTIVVEGLAASPTSAALEVGNAVNNRVWNAKTLVLFTTSVTATAAGRARALLTLQNALRLLP